MTQTRQFLKHQRAMFKTTWHGEASRMHSGLVGYNRVLLGVSQTIPAVPSLNLEHYFFIDMFGEVNNLLPLENNDAFEAGLFLTTYGLIKRFSITYNNNNIVLTQDNRHLVGA